MRIYVTNFPAGTLPADLKEWFEPHGKVQNTVTCLDRNGARIGFVEMPNDQEAANAIAALHHSFQGPDDNRKRLVVKPAKVRGITPMEAPHPTR